jgi:hypothetical protein
MAKLILIVLAPIGLTLIIPTAKAILTNLWHTNRTILKAPTLIIPTAIITLAPTPFQLNLTKLRASTGRQAITSLLAIASQTIKIKWISILKIMKAN